MFPGQDGAYFLRTFHRMGSLIMAYAFHTEDEDEDEDDDEENEDEEAEPKVNVSMVPMADMLNHKTGHNNVRLSLENVELDIVTSENKD